MSLTSASSSAGYRRAVEIQGDQVGPERGTESGRQFLDKGFDGLVDGHPLRLDRWIVRVKRAVRSRHPQPLEFLRAMLSAEPLRTIFPNLRSWSCRRAVEGWPASSWASRR